MYESTEKILNDILGGYFWVSLYSPGTHSFSLVLGLEACTITTQQYNLKVMLQGISQMFMLMLL